MVEARRSPLPREAQEQTTCDRWEEPGVGAAGSLPSLATRLLGADFRKGKCCAGAAFPVVAAARASGQAQQIRGCCPTPGGARGTFPGQEPRARGTMAKHNLPPSSVGSGWGALGMEGLTRCPWDSGFAVWEPPEHQSHQRLVTCSLPLITSRPCLSCTCSHSSLGQSFRH